MKRRNLRVLTGVAVTALAISTLQIPAQAANAPADRDPAAAQAKKQDDLKSPLGEKQRALREKATQQLIKGTAKIETKGGERASTSGGTARAGRRSTSSTPSSARSRSSRSCLALAPP